MASSSDPAVVRPLRQLWQVPIFLLGLATLAGFFLTRPLWRDPLAAHARGLDKARRLLADGRSNRAERLAQAYLDHAGEGPRSAEAHLLLGWALSRQAQAAAGEEALQRWRQARGHLEQADQLGVAEADQALLTFRRGVAGYYCGDDPAEAVDRLKDTVEHVADRVEGYRVLVRARLALSRPDLRGALDANEKLRLLPLVGEDVLGPARVEGGELLLRLKRPAEARKLLEKVDAAAGPAVLARARMLLAKSHEADEAWAEAAAVWQEVLDTSGLRPADPGPALYQLGVCHRRLEQLEDAARAWEQCLEQGQGDITRAAALGLAEVRLSGPAPETAVEAFARAVQGVDRPRQWPRGAGRLVRARKLFVHACEHFRRKGDHDRAARVALLYQQLAPARGQLLHGQVAAEWARSLRQKARAAKPDEARGLREKADALYRQAGDSYLRSADETTGVDAKQAAERLWLAAGSYLQAQEVARAVPVLQRYLKTDGLSEARTGEAWYLLGEAQRWLKQDAQAESAYKDGLRCRSIFAYRSRYYLAQYELRRGHTDAAVEGLEQNLKLLRLDPDDEALEKTLFTLGGLLSRRRSHDSARPLLEEALSKFPGSALAARGRFDLAESYRMLAAQENQNFVLNNKLTPQARQHYQKQHRQWLEKAAAQYQELSAGLADGRVAAGVLTAREQVQVFFGAAECRFNLGDYEAALALYDQLAERYKDRAERLNALGGTVQCYAAQGQQQKLRQRLEEIKLSLRFVDEATRRQWEEWLSVAGRLH